MTENSLMNPHRVELCEIDCDEVLPLDSAEVVEVPLLLSGKQMLALEEAAHDRGLTAGEMVRRLLKDFFAGAMACKVRHV